MPPLLISMRSAFIVAMTVSVLLIALPAAYADTSLYKYIRPRVSHLQLSVEQAKHGLDAAYRERNDLR